MRMRSRTLECRTVSGERKDRLGASMVGSSPCWWTDERVVVIVLVEVDTVQSPSKDLV